MLFIREPSGYSLALACFETMSLATFLHDLNHIPPVFSNIFENILLELSNYVDGPTRNTFFNYLLIDPNVLNSPDTVFCSRFLGFYQFKFWRDLKKKKK